MDRFEEVRNYVLSVQGGLQTIGTLGERSLHAILKHYFEPNTDCHEIKIGKYYADIANDKGIIEIQTRHFNKLRTKLDAFLPDQPVTIVFPIAYQKWILWISEETGEVTKRRLSPKRGTFYDIFPELYRIKSYLSHENIRLHIIRVDMEEYRLLNGWSEDHKKGSWRKDRIPAGICDELLITSREDYVNLIPDPLCEPFTSRDFAKAAKVTLRNAQTGLNILHDLGVVRRVGKISNAFTYERAL